jgi:hypothetical protein
MGEWGRRVPTKLVGFVPLFSKLMFNIPDIFTKCFIPFLIKFKIRINLDWGQVFTVIS